MWFLYGPAPPQTGFLALKYQDETEANQSARWGGDVWLPVASLSSLSVSLQERTSVLIFVCPSSLINIICSTNVRLSVKQTVFQKNCSTDQPHTLCSVTFCAIPSIWIQIAAVLCVSRFVLSLWTSWVFFFVLRWTTSVIDNWVKQTVKVTEYSRNNSEVSTQDKKTQHFKHTCLQQGLN